MLALDPSVGYIHEPFNIDHDVGICGAQFDHWYTYVCTDNAKDYHVHLERTLQFHHALVNKLKSSRASGLQRTLKLTGRSFQYRLFGCRPLMKDPIAVFSAEWLAKTFDAVVVVVVRHPAAVAGSYKVQNWSVQFDDFLKQPLLLRDKLNSYRSEIEEFAASNYDIADQAGLLWKLIYSTVLRYQEDHPEWIFVRHEDVSLDPVGGFVQLYNQLGLEMNKNIIKTIIEHSYSKTSSELRRDSKSNIAQWKNRLSSKEIARVKEITEGVSSRFYSDESW
jgi:hypothetical protein